MTLFSLSYLAGVLTIFAPCILPVLHFVLARVDQPFCRSGFPLLCPANYFVDAQGRIRLHHFGEGEYERSEQVIQQLARGECVRRSHLGAFTACSPFQAAER
jgi:hypothetical protein